MKEFLIPALIGAALLFPSIASSESSTVKVGKIKIRSNAAGLFSFGIENGGVFDGCTRRPGNMYGSFKDLRFDERQSALDLLLTAKSLGRPVTVAYDVDERGYCHYYSLEIQ